MRIPSTFTLPMTIVRGTRSFANQQWKHVSQYLSPFGSGHPTGNSVTSTSGIANTVSQTATGRRLLESTGAMPVTSLHQPATKSSATSRNMSGPRLPDNAFNRAVQQIRAEDGSSWKMYMNGARLDDIPELRAALEPSERGLDDIIQGFSITPA